MFARINEIHSALLQGDDVGIVPYNDSLNHYVYFLSKKDAVCTTASFFCIFSIIMGTLFSLVDKLVSSLSATVVSIACTIIGIQGLPTKATPYSDGMNWVVIALFCLVPMIAWALTLIAMKGYALDGKRVKTIQAVNAARKTAVENGMSMEEAMATITDETVEKA